MAQGLIGHSFYLWCFSIIRSWDRILEATADQEMGHVKRLNYS
jgi:hypothetical protein